MVRVTSVQRLTNAFNITRGTQVIPDIMNQERVNIPVTCIINCLPIKIGQEDARTFYRSDKLQNYFEFNLSL
jgi:hypothetical protein